MFFNHCLRIIVPSCNSISKYIDVICPKVDRDEHGTAILSVDK